MWDERIGYRRPAESTALHTTFRQDIDLKYLATTLPQYSVKQSESNLTAPLHTFNQGSLTIPW